MVVKVGLGVPVDGLGLWTVGLQTAPTDGEDVVWENVFSAGEHVPTQDR